MNSILAQAEIPTLPGDPKTWLTVVAGLLVTMIVGRFIQAFKNGAGIIDAGKAVLFGTNVPKPPTDKPTDAPSSKTSVYSWLLVGILALSVTSCGVFQSSFNSNVFNSEKLAADSAIGATHFFNQYYAQQTNGASEAAIAELNKQRAQLYDTDRKLSASLAVLDAVRRSYLTNTADTNKAALLAALDAVKSQSGSITNLVATFTQK